MILREFFQDILEQLQEIISPKNTFFRYVIWAICLNLYAMMIII